MLVEINNLTKIYSNKIAIDGMSLSLPSGKIIGLLGPNGSGKTTLFKIMAGLLKQTSGEVTIDGKPVGEETKSIISFLPERTYLSPNATISSVVDFFEDFYSDFDRNSAEQMLKVLAIDPKRKMKELSKGMKEKVQLSLVMSRKAKLYLLDEPIGGVDPATRDFILNTVIKNYNKEATILISTHLIYDVEPILDEYVFLYEGKVLEKGSVKQRKEETGKTIDELFREAFRCY